MSGPAARAATSTDAPAIAALHATRISGGFLATLGPKFLTRLYARAVRSPHAFVLVVAGPESTEAVAGFVAVADDTGRFYRDFLVHDAIAAGVAAAPALLRRPKRVWETFRYGTGAAGDLPAAEVLAIAVSARAAGRGLGGVLLDAAIAEMRRRAIPSARVVTAVDNAAALRMYERAGFVRHGRTEVHAGTPQEVLVWR